MMNVHAKYLNADEVKELTSPLLKKQFSAYDFRTVNVREDETFDGASVFRITVDVGEKVPVDKLVDALDVLHSTLRSKGEERLIFLSTNVPSPGQEATGENEEDME
ncbi:hypothetical protein [Pararhizobium sp. LjRoot238]|uniref:hypothetical protein n=1 Tax=Pararhizobium sp. LjRoot238 TaxID=3342293 RepID=UPI003ECC8F35